MSGRIAEVTVELLRAGPAHNRLLSPLTDYVALCGNHGVSAVRVPFEHNDLQKQLEALSYRVGDQQREYQVEKLGRDVGGILGSIPGIPSEVAHAEASAAQDGFIHLRLVLWGNELGLIPFELATTPPGLAGEGQALLLRARTPVVLTREVRGARARAVEWDRKPRLLFIAASPPDLAPVPMRSNAAALREALEGLVRYDADKVKQVEEIERHLTILPDATLTAVREACAAAFAEGRPYTHVHVLAHGMPLSQQGEARFGLALHGEREAQEIVSAQRLAHALGGAAGREGVSRLPLAITLASCESAAGGSVLVPGGSIAHELHQAGIPWVVASQFPLTFDGSVDIARVWYGEVLRGVDPRRALHTVRSRLFTRESTTHDWASLVAYATIPDGFSEEVERFRYRQDVERAHRALSAAEHGKKSPKDAITGARSILDEHEGRLPTKASLVDPNEPMIAAVRATRADFLKRRGSFEKRAALLVGGKERAAALARAREFYRRSFHEEGDYHHWALTQVLSLTIVLGEEPDEWLWRAAWMTALNDYYYGDPDAYRYALPSLIEILALSATLGRERYSLPAMGEVKAEMARYATELTAAAKSQELYARTITHFNRYRVHWKNPKYDELIEYALELLPDPESPRPRANEEEPIPDEATTDFSDKVS